MEIYTQEATIDSRGMMIMVVTTEEQQQLPPPPPLITTTTTTTQTIPQWKPPPPPFPAVQVWEDHKRCHSQKSLLRQRLWGWNSTSRQNQDSGSPEVCQGLPFLHRFSALFDETQGAMLVRFKRTQFWRSFRDIQMCVE
jgi:hypothetical protein